MQQIAVESVATNGVLIFFLKINIHHPVILGRKKWVNKPLSEKGNKIFNRQNEAGKNRDLETIMNEKEIT